MFSMLYRAMHGSRPADGEPLSDPDPDLDPGSAFHRQLPRIHSLDQDRDASAGPANLRTYAQLRHATADFTEADDDDDDDDSNDGLGGEDQLAGDDDAERRSSHVLPLFSATHLDSLPVYSIVHAIRIIVQARTETTLSWDQLRSPQVSQFLVKPMQQLIRTQHFSRATLYALMANCLQFAKEGQLYPGNAGTSSTRAKVCELLAIKLLKEYTTRELIDALSYDFNPLQGIPHGPQSQPHSSAAASRDGRPKLATTARTSTLEVAIRANAKHFVAHPLVVQQLEAIWNGAISFYSYADSLHRKPEKPPAKSFMGATPPRVLTRRDSTRGLGRYGTADPRTPLLGGGSRPRPSCHGQQPQHHEQPGKEDQARSHIQFQPPPAAFRRRTVTLYDPRNASLFKLSRLRVPRYRQFLSTCSLAVLIGLFLSVLVEHSNRITSLELVFWFWSAGFMLDELVGFTEQGFSLYIMSFWNIFDLGILLLLIFYYSLRVCGVFLADASRWNDSAYDILAANAILLLPRIFSVLDHYQYFSQLLIAFRLMAVDLAAVFVLIFVACSGFFVFFTLSHRENDPGDVAYKIFQILMGFTPAAWEVWTTYNYLGKALMALFLIICHFVVMTILITVLTNSFMAIATNANEEHQFLFAINTISMVKNDALFSYVAPTNIFAWMLMPLRYCMPLPHFVAFNRLVIKITHFPLLFGIFIYEKFFLAPSMYEPTDLVEHPRRRHRAISFADPANRPVFFSPSIRLREESIAGFQKDRALDEVFRRTPDIASLRTQRRHERRKTQTAIRNWMDQNDDYIDGRMEGDWPGRASLYRDRGSHRFRHMSEARSAASDPADLLSLSAFPSMARDMGPEGSGMLGGPFEAAFKDHTDAEGDDELVTNDEDEENTTTNTGEQHPTPEGAAERHVDEEEEDDDDDFFTTPTASRFLNMQAQSPQSPETEREGQVRYIGSTPTMSSPKPNTSRRALHSRALSSNTILYNPPPVDSEDENVIPRQSPKSFFSPSSPKPASPSRPRPLTSRQNTPTSASPNAGQRSPRRSMHQATRPRPVPIPPPRDIKQSTPGRTAAIFQNAAMLDTPVRRAQRRMSSVDTGLDAHSELTSAVGPPMGDEAAFAALPGSFVSQLALAQAMNTRVSGESDRDRDRMSRLVLARMKTLEESFTDVVRELRTLKNQQERTSSGRATRQASSVSNSEDDGDGAGAGAGAGAGISISRPVSRGKRSNRGGDGSGGASVGTGSAVRRRPRTPGGLHSGERFIVGGSGGEGDSHGRRAKGKEVESFP